MGDCPEPYSLENAVSPLNDQCCVFNAVSASDDDPTDAVVWERAEPDVRKMQRGDNPKSRIFYWTGIAKDATMSSLGTNLIQKDEAVQHGSETVASWSNWSKLTVKYGILYRKWFQTDTNEPLLQLNVPATGRKEIIEQLHSSPVSGGHYAVEKTLARNKQRYWWSQIRPDVEKRRSWCLPCAARIVAGRKRVESLVPFMIAIRFHRVAADILCPITPAKKYRAKNILVMTDLFTKYSLSVPLVSTQSSELAKQIVVKWVLLFGVPNVLHTDQGISFDSKFMLEVCRQLKIKKTRTSP